MLSSAIKRHGGKAYLAPEIIAMMPYHNRYAEAFFGSGAVLFAKSCDGIAEWANDVDGELTNFWRVLAAPDAFPVFQRIVEAVPFSKVEFEAARHRAENLTAMPFDCIGRAVDFFVVNRQSRQALGKSFATPTTRLRSGMNENVSAWLNAISGLREFHTRLKRVEIWNEDAVSFIDKLDKSVDTLFYLDPPYMHETRGTARNEYGKHEMSDAQHIALLDYLGRGMRAKVILSGYPCELYNSKLTADKGWSFCDIEIDNKSSSAGIKEMKIERIWTNYAK